MGFRFNRRIKIGPGIRLNVSKSGVSTSVGRRGAWFTFGGKVTRSTVGIPGTGVSYTETERSGGGSGVVVLLLLLGALVLWFLF